MKKLKKLLLLLPLMFSMSLSACAPKNGIDGHTPEIVIGDNGHWFIDGEDTGVNAQGPQGDQGIQGEKGDKGDKGDAGDKGDKGDIGETGAQGPKGDKGDTGEQGPQGEKGETGPQGEPGKDGQDGKDGADGKDGESISFVSCEKSATNGFYDTYTITFSDDSSTEFFVPSTLASLDVELNRESYFAETSMELDISVTANFAEGTSFEVDNFEVEGFDLSVAGKPDVKVSVGPVSEKFSVLVEDISDVIADALALEDDTLIDSVPGYHGVGVHDYQYVSSYHALLAELDDGVETSDAITAYKAQLVQGGWTSLGEDTFGDEYFKSPNNELKIGAYDYYGMVRVDIAIIKPAATPADSTPRSVMADVLVAMYGNYTFEQLISYQVALEVSTDVWYGYASLMDGDYSSYFDYFLSQIEDNYLPKYLIADGDAYMVDYDEDGEDDSLAKDYITSDGTVEFEVIMNVYNGSTYADFYSSYAD